MGISPKYMTISYNPRLIELTFSYDVQQYKERIGKEIFSKFLIFNQL
jgi:hypothetical protein